MTARPFEYEEAMGRDEKRSFKERVLVENPDTLFLDTRRNNTRCNLIFLTNFPEDWEATLLEEYAETKRIQLPDKIKLELSNNRGTVCIYPSGKFVIQGSEENLDVFDGNFKRLLESFEANRLQRQIEKIKLEESDEENDDDD